MGRISSFLAPVLCVLLVIKINHSQALPLSNVQRVELQNCHGRTCPEGTFACVKQYYPDIDRTHFEVKIYCLNGAGEILKSYSKTIKSLYGDMVKMSGYQYSSMHSVSVDPNPSNTTSNDQMAH